MRAITALVVVHGGGGVRILHPPRVSTCTRQGASTLPAAVAERVATGGRRQRRCLEGGVLGAATTAYPPVPVAPVGLSASGEGEFDRLGKEGRQGNALGQ